VKKLILGVVLALAAQCAIGQSAIIRGEESAGVYQNLKSTSGVLQAIINSGTVTVNPPVATLLDPCGNVNVAKSSVVISLSSAATTSLVAISGTTTIYVCGVSMSISQVVTTANTIKFVTGTGATCGTGTTDRTGAFGTGGVTAGIPIVVTLGYGGHTAFQSLAGDRLCATTTIGGSGAFMGVLTYVQQ
jgi:hypothetical protein